MGILTRDITLTPASGYSFVTIASGPATGTNTVKGQYGALAVGDQVEWDNTSGISVSADGTITRTGTGDVSFNARIWATATLAWSTTQLLAFTGLSLTGQALTLSGGTPTVFAASGTSLSGQALTVSQGTPAVVGNARVALTGQSVTASQGAVVAAEAQGVVLTGQAGTIGQGTPAVVGHALVALSGQNIAAEQGTPSFSIGGAVTVGMTGQGLSAVQGTPTVYSSRVAISLSGQDILIFQDLITKVDEGQIYNNWVGDSPASFDWTPEVETASNWIHGAR